MWVPKQLLTDKVVQTLREAGYSESKIEFLGWQSGIAGALNKSGNPAKAANTILSRPSGARMAAAFYQKKKDSVVLPEPKATDATDQIFRKLAKLEEKAKQAAEESVAAAAGKEDE
jgi:ubiquinone biosynthesis protein COQ9